MGLRREQGIRYDIIFGADTCKADMAIVDDGSGNHNNLFNVKITPKSPEALPKPNEEAVVVEQPEAKTETSPAPKDLDTHALDQATAPVHHPEQSTKDLDATTHVSTSDKAAAHSDDTANSDIFVDASNVEEGEHDAPLLRHETLSAGPEEEDDGEDDEPSHYYNDDRGLEHDAPLMKHETLGLDIVDEHQVPLFRHETMMEDDTARSPPSGAVGLALDNAIVDDRDVEDFPTDQVSIMEHLRRTSMRLPEDETAIEGTPPSPSMASPASSAENALTKTSSDVSQLSSQLDAIDESAEEDHDNRKHDHHNSHKHEQQPSVRVELLTPPMTPLIAEMEVDEGRFQSMPTEIPQSVSKGTRNRADNSTDNISNKSSTPANEDVIRQGPAAGLLSFVKGYVIGLSTWFAGLCGGTGRAT